MILLTAVLLGLLAGLGRARLGGRSFRLTPLNQLWLLILAIFLQGLALYFPHTLGRLSDRLAPSLHVLSQAGLLVFVWLNRREPGFWILGLGVALNLWVIAANGGWMPISPETANHLRHAGAVYAGETGARFGGGKDILLARADTLFWCLSDRFLLPAWFPWRVAFSLGDVLIASGAFVALWARGGPQGKEAR
jgi:hypothetical protein